MRKTPSLNARHYTALAMMLGAIVGAFVSRIPQNISAQETYSVSGSAGQVGDLQQYLLAQNRTTCALLNLAITCTQAQACTAANAPGGASCTAVQARGANVRIWPDTQAGREEYVTFGVAAPKLAEIRAVVPGAFIAGPAMGDYCRWWKANSGSQAAECAKIGATSGCVVCL